MFKRVIWFGGGVASGAAGSWYVRRKVRRQVERYSPAGIKRVATARAQQATADVRRAVVERRDAVRSRRSRPAHDSSAEVNHLRIVPD